MTAAEERLISQITDAAREAGKIMLSASHVRESAAVKEGHANYVTAFDRKIQEFLFQALGEILPEAHFIGEENGADQFTGEDREGFAFCVDPIDGTSNFLTGFRPSVTSIALLRDGKGYLGVVYNPYQDEMYSAVRGCGACCNRQPILSSAQPLSESMVSFGTSPYRPDLHEFTFAVCRDYLSRCIDLRRTGSAAWDLVTVANGTVGLFFEKTLALWDYAAGGLIAQEAGCVLTDMEGRELGWDGPTSILCASRGVAREDYLPRIRAGRTVSDM